MSPSSDRSLARYFQNGRVSSHAPPALACQVPVRCSAPAPMRGSLVLLVELLVLPAAVPHAGLELSASSLTLSGSVPPSPNA